MQHSPACQCWRRPVPRCGKQGRHVRYLSGCCLCQRPHLLPITPEGLRLTPTPPVIFRIRRRADCSPAVVCVRTSSYYRVENPRAYSRYSPFNCQAKRGMFPVPCLPPVSDLRRIVSNLALEAHSRHSAAFTRNRCGEPERMVRASALSASALLLSLDCDRLLHT